MTRGRPAGVASPFMNDDSTRLKVALRRLDNQSLWDFALDFYARPGVEQACLLLQDEAGLDVCELLWHCWLYRHGLALAHEPGGLAAIRRWQREVTEPLRSLRRALKTPAQHSPGVAEVRRHLKRAELEAEHQTLTRLQALTGQEPALMVSLDTTSSLEKSLMNMMQLQKKAHVFAIQTLESRLDPPPAAR